MPDKTSIETVYDLLPQLSAPQQREVRNFVEFLLQKSVQKTVQQQEQDERDWAAFSLASAMRGMEDEDTLYDETDSARDLVLNGSEARSNSPVTFSQHRSQTW